MKAESCVIISIVHWKSWRLVGVRSVNSWRIWIKRLFLFDENFSPHELSLVESFDCCLHFVLFLKRNKGAALFLAFHINWDDNCHDSAIFRKEFSKLIFTRMIAQTADVELIDFLRELKLEPNVKRFSFVVLQRHEK